METVYSVNNVPFRLTEERWNHIVNNKLYMESYYERVLDAVEKPTFVLRGYSGSLIAITNIGKQRYLHLVYKEVTRDDGFIITAFIAQNIIRE